MLRSGIALILPLLLLLAGCTLDPEVRKQRLVETGNKYYDTGKFREASIIYRRAIQQDRRYGEAYYRLGLAETAAGRVAAAIASLTRATELQPENEDAFGQLTDLYLTVFAADPARRDAYIREIKRLTERAEENFPESFAVHRVRGYLALHAQDYALAVERLGAAHEKRPDHAGVTLALAEAFEGTGRLEESEKLARDYIEQHPSEAGVYNYLYVRLFQQNRRDEALALLEQKCERNPDVATFTVELARHHYVLGDRTKMDEVLDELLKKPDSQAYSHTMVGDFFMRVGEFARATEMFRKGAELSEANRIGLLNRTVESLAVQGKREEAFELVTQVLDEDSENSQALALRGALRLRTGNKEGLEEAISDFEAVLTRMPENVVLRYNLAEAYLAYGQRDRAIVEFQAAIKRRPDYLPPHYGLARIYLMGQEYARAVAEAEEILKIRPNDPGAKLIRSHAWMNLGETQQARSALEELVTQQPESAEPIFQLARLSLRERNYREAERLFRKLASSNPPDRRGILGLVETYIAQNRGAEGLNILEQQIEKEPDNLWWRKAMGTAASRAASFDRAQQELQYVIGKEPEDQQAHKQLAGVYYRTRQLDQAQSHFEKAQELNPVDPVPVLYLALMHEGNGNLQEAVKSYEKVVELSPNNEVALNNLAYILAETTDELDRALTLAQRAVSVSPNNVDIADTLSWVYIKKNLNDNAIRILEGNLAKQPNNVTWRYHLAMALYQKGDYSRAKKELESALRNKPNQKQEEEIRRLLARVSS